MNLRIYNLTEFKGLSTGDEQIKEICFLFGLCISRISNLENYFINQLRFIKSEFEGHLIGKTPKEEKIKKFENHINQAATLKMLVNDFKEKSDTTNLDDSFDELIRIRNLLAHQYMRENWEKLSDHQVRIEIYDDLLGVHSFLEQLDKDLKKQTFFTKANNSFGMRLKDNKSQPVDESK